MVAEVGETGVAFVEEDVLATVIDLSVNKATQVRVGVSYRAPLKHCS